MAPAFIFNPIHQFQYTSHVNVIDLGNLFSPLCCPLERFINLYCFLDFIVNR